MLITGDLATLPVCILPDRVRRSGVPNPTRDAILILVPFPVYSWEARCGGVWTQDLAMMAKCCLFVVLFVSLNNFFVLWFVCFIVSLFIHWLVCSFIVCLFVCLFCLLFGPLHFVVHSLDCWSVCLLLIGVVCWFICFNCLLILCFVCRRAHWSVCWVVCLFFRLLIVSLVQSLVCCALICLSVGWFIHWLID